jgi:holliday junction DNA helicase RuvA
LIGFVRGNLFEIRNDSIVVDCSGIGYEIFCNLKDISELTPQKGREILIHTYLQHKEDTMMLYGFINEKTKKGFTELLRVDGIGPKLAMKILSRYDVGVLFKAIESEDIDSLKKIPGVGQKMAGKMIFDLKGKLPSFETTVVAGMENDLLNAMINLGYQESDIKEKLKKIKPLSSDFEAEFKKLLKLVAGK